MNCFVLVRFENSSESDFIQHRERREQIISTSSNLNCYFPPAIAGTMLMSVSLLTEISPKDYLKAEQYALEENLQLLGVYHSHPNHPAIPSEQDRIAAQPFFSYIIISVSGNNTIHLRSWRLNDSFQFDEEEISHSIIKQH